MGKVKKNLESVAASKLAGATAVEATNATMSLAAVANDPEASSDVKALATVYYRELQALPGDSARREALMAQATAFAARVAS